MNLLPRTLGGQLLALLLTALAASLLISLGLSTAERADAVREADRTGLFETIVTLRVPVRPPNVAVTVTVWFPVTAEAVRTPPEVIVAMSGLEMSPTT